MTLSLDEAMDRYARGDDRAFAAIYRAVAPALRALALRQLREPALADDVVQHALLNMHRARAGFIAGARVLPWGYAIARRLVVDAVRRRRRERALEQSAPPAAAARPDEELAAKQTARRLASAVAALPAGQRAVLDLRHRGLGVKEIASHLGTSTASVKLRLHRAHRSLRAAATP